jgi:hypothetical protein
LTGIALCGCCRRSSAGGVTPLACFDEPRRDLRVTTCERPEAAAPAGVAGDEELLDLAPHIGCDFA